MLCYNGVKFSWNLQVFSKCFYEILYILLEQPELLLPNLQTPQIMAILKQVFYFLIGVGTQLMPLEFHNVPQRSRMFLNEKQSALLKERSG
jgi:hypothetical protein